MSAAPRLLLSLRSLHGPTLATRDRLLEVVSRYREPESLAVTLAKAVAVPVDGVFTCSTPAIRAALAELNSPVPLVVIVPALSEYERQELGAELERVIDSSRARARAARLGGTMAGLWHPAMFGRGDFAWRMPVLIETELAGLPRKQLRGVVLDAWFTDLALAAGNRRMFESYTRYVRRRIKVAAGFETRNLGLLLAQLREWQIAPDFVAGPVNPSGLLMKPSPEELLAEVRRGHVPVVARELCAGGVDALDAAAAFAHEHGAYGLAPDITEMDDVGAELRALMREAVGV
jgi:hypothetical protein